MINPTLTDSKNLPVFALNPPFTPACRPGRL